MYETHLPTPRANPRRSLALALGFCVLGALITTPAMADGQDDTGPTAAFGEMVEVSEVLLDVLVTDRQGDVVLGLEASDFILEENGVERSVSGASFYSNRFKVRDGEQGLQKPLPNEVLADRHFILYFHDPRLSGGGLQGRLIRQHLDATRRSREWVETEMLPGDWVAVVSYGVKLKVHQDFTQDRGALVAAIDQAAKGKDPSNEWASRRPEVAAGQPALLPHLPEGKALRKETTRMYGALQILAEASRDIVGRKNVLLFTLGFGDVERLGALISEPDQRFYPEMKEALNDNNMAIHPINLLPEARFNLQGHFLNQLAIDSGGTYYENFVNFIAPIRTIADESNGYYLLSYQAEHPAGESGYREVEVKTRNPEFRVQARQGYKYGS